MANKFLVRRDMKHGLTVMINEEDVADRPYTAVATIHGPRGHMIVMLRQDGSFAVEIHPDGGNPIDVAGVMNLFAAIIERVGDVTVNQTSKPKMN